MHCQNRDLREQVYRAMVSVASMGDLDNGPRIEKILKLRKEKAQLLGYASHAEISLATKMAPSVGAVDKLTANSETQLSQRPKKTRMPWLLSHVRQPVTLRWNC